MSRAIAVLLALATFAAAQAEAEPASDPLQVAQMVRRKPKTAPAPEAPIPKPADATPGAPATSPAAAPAASPAGGRAMAPAAANAPAATEEPRTEAQAMKGARPAKFDRTQFRSDPVYKLSYDPAAQQQVYGGKSAMNIARPLMELGHPLYHEGAFGDGGTWLGKKNPTLQQVLLYGDWRGVGAYVDDAIPGGDGKKANERVATRLNLDLDWHITGTERVHFLFRPLDRKGNFTHYDFQGGPEPDGKGSTSPINGNIAVGFLEGDLGAVTQGITGRYNHLDLPFAVGLIPLQFQNGIWVNDAFTGVAATIPAMNSAKLDIPNMDVTFFAGGDKVSLPGVLTKTDGTADDHHGRVIGVATFADTREGYWEGGYGYVYDDRGLPDDASFHSVTASFTKRYGGWLANSVRVLGAFGQQKPAAGPRTAGGVLLLIENSLITSKPYTLVPYFNLFVGSDTPQPLVRDPGAGGVLSNTGMVFEADGLSGFPTLDASGKRAAGGAFGLEYLFGLDQQLVAEVGGLQRTGSSAPNDSSDYGLALRYQIPFAKRLIFRFDAIAGRVKQGDPLAERDISGVRVELRVKF